MILNHRLEKIHNNKTIEEVHLSNKNKLTKYNQLKKLNQTLPVMITQKPQGTPKHVNCESTDDES